MEIVPVHSEIEIEHVPADSLPGVRSDRRCVTSEGTPIETERGEIVATHLYDAVLAGPIIRPGDLTANPDGHVWRVEGKVDGHDVRGTRPTLLHGH